MQTALFYSQKRFSEKEFSKEKELEDLMFNNSKCLFGQASILIEAKKKIDNKALGGTIPDAFLVDLKDPDNPEFIWLRGNWQSTVFTIIYSHKSRSSLPFLRIRKVKVN